MSQVGLRILVVGLNFAPEPTGIAPYTAGMCRGLSSRGHHVRVMTAFPHYPKWRLAESDVRRWRREESLGAVSVLRLRHLVPNPPVGVRRAIAELSFGFRVIMQRWHGPDVVICVSPALLATAMVTLRVRLSRSRPAIGCVVQDLYGAGVVETGSANSYVARLIGLIETSVMRNVNGVIAIHNRFRDRLVKHSAAKVESLAVVRNWTHVEPVARFDRLAFRSSMGWSPNETVVLHAGAMGEKQALENVVQTAKLAEVRNEKVRFVLMGDGGQRARLESVSVDIMNCDVIPPIESARFARALRSADVLLVNERVGFSEMAVPSKLTSYFSSGTPVLAATEMTSTTAEELAAAGAGMRVPPGDPQALLDGVLAMRDDPERMAEMGSRGPAYCDKVLSETAALDAYDRWVRSLHRRRHGG